MCSSCPCRHESCNFAPWYAMARRRRRRQVTGTVLLLSLSIRDQHRVPRRHSPSPSTNVVTAGPGADHRLDHRHTYLLFLNRLQPLSPGPQNRCGGSHGGKTKNARRLGEKGLPQKKYRRGTVKKEGAKAGGQKRNWPPRGFVGAGRGELETLFIIIS